MRVTLIFLWILAAIVAFGTLAPYPASAADKDTELILAELRQLQAQVSQFQRTQGEMERILGQLAARAEEESSLRQTLVDTQTTLEEMRESLSILSSRLDETNDRIGNIRRELAAMKQTQQPILIAPDVAAENPEAGQPPSGAGGSPPSETPAPPSVTAAAPSAVDLYNQAYTDYTQMRYPLAVSGFKDVIQRYAESDLADNAQYWIGECYLAQRQYKEALEAFESVLIDYPESNKRPEAAYKRAQTLESLGRREEAIEQLELVIEQFPGTQVERNATLLLKKLRSYQP